MENKVVKTNFWPPYWDNNAPTLIEDDLGWGVARCRDAGSDKCKDVFDFCIGYLGYDLSFYFVDTDKFYYINVLEGFVCIKEEDPSWDGVYDYDRVSDSQQPHPSDDQIIFEFDSVEQLWDNFKIAGKDLEYILNRSVLWLET